MRREFYAAGQVAVSELERWAAVRERRRKAHNTEAVRLTRNLVAALVLHDASRDLDPQLHVHAVVANVTWDAERQVQVERSWRSTRFLTSPLSNDRCSDVSKPEPRGLSSSEVIPKLRK